MNTSLFLGTKCEQCTSLTCYNGGTCQINNNTVSNCYGPRCTVPSKVTCKCRPGFDPTTQCSVASCQYMTCSTNQKCLQQQDGSLKCVCKEGFSGKNCEKRTSVECGIQCQNGGLSLLFHDNIEKNSQDVIAK